MKLSKFEELMIKNSSKYNMEKGKELLENKELLKLNVHKNDYIYNIYGNFKQENSNEFFSSHLKIDTKNEKIIILLINLHYKGDYMNKEREKKILEEILKSKKVTVKELAKKLYIIKLIIKN